MKRPIVYIFALMAVAVLVACGPPAGLEPPSNNANTNSNTNAAKPVAAAPTKEAIMTMEKAGWDAWKARDAKWTEENASDKYVGFGSTGRMDKAASVKSYTEQKCEIKSYTLSDDQLQMVGPDVAVLTFKGEQDYTCDGKKGPANVRSASIYVRDGDKWKSAFYAETPVVDPKAPAADPASKKEEAKAAEAKPDTAAERYLAHEKKLWDGWKAKDAKPLEEAFGKDFSYYSGAGRMDRAATIKEWTSHDCVVKSYTLTDGQAVELTKDVTLLTYKGAVDGTCGGKPATTDWYAAIDMKNGDAWQSVFGMSLPIN